jgi:hypothetical protein
MRVYQGSSTADVFNVTKSAGGKIWFLNHDNADTNPTLDIDVDGNNSSDLKAIRIDVDNAGAGDGVGIDFSSMGSPNKPFKFTANATDPTGGGGAADGRVPIDIGGVTKYFAYWDA